VRGHGSIVEPPLIGQKDRRGKFAVLLDRVASKPAPSPAACPPQVGESAAPLKSKASVPLA
jgi:hypothetical protein